MTESLIIYANCVIALAGIVTAWAAVASARYARKSIADQQESFRQQIDEYRLSLSAETALKLKDSFGSPAFKKIRGRAAKALLDRRNEAEAEDVFDFFETVGLFVKLGALSDEVAYSVFFHWINLYWRAGKHHIASRRTEAAAVWGSFEFLFNKLGETERRSHPDSEDLKMPDSRLRQQLVEEQRLDSGADHAHQEPGTFIHFRRPPSPRIRGIHDHHAR